MGERHAIDQDGVTVSKLEIGLERPAQHSRQRPVEASGVAPSSIPETLESHLPSLRHFALSLTRGKDAADDLVQNCLVRALSHMDRFQPGTSLRKWLFTILYNNFRDDLRRRRREGQQVSLSDWQDLRPQAPSQYELVRFKEVALGFQHLHPEQRRLLTIVGIEGESYEVAARHFGVPVGTIKSRLWRARNRLLQQQHGLGQRRVSNAWPTA